MGDYYESPAKATGNNRFDAYPNRNDWYETVKLNYGTDYIHNTGNHFSPIPDTWHKMKDILLFWAGKGIDGFRCDMAQSLVKGGSVRVLGMGHSGSKSQISKPDIYCRSL